MHIGAYWDPGMEFDLPVNYEYIEPTELEKIFDQPFSGSGIRIIKSHTLAHNIEYVKQHWPDCPIVLVHRNNDACFGWWIRCGGFDISYPNYRPYYQDLDNMAHQIDQQNADIIRAWDKYQGNTATNNHELAHILGINLDSDSAVHNYTQADIKVKII